MPKDDFKAVLNGMLYTHTIDGTGWPDAVSVCNNAAFPDEYEDRIYYPIDVKALLELADAMEEKADDWDVSQDDVPLVHAGYLTAYAERIRKALGVSDG